MGIVKMKAVLSGKGRQVSSLGDNPTIQDILHAGRSKEILLTQTQIFTIFAGVIRIENHGDFFSVVDRCHRRRIITSIEFIEVKLLSCSGSPQTQSIDRAILITGNRHIIGNSTNVVVVDPAYSLASRSVSIGFTVPPELDTLSIFRPLNLPAIINIKPMIWLFNLITIDDALVKHPIFIANAITLNRQLQGGAAVKKTGSQAAKSTITQPGIRLNLFQFFHLNKDI